MSDTTVTSILRKQFPAQEVGKLPRVTCGDCSDKRKTCDRHQKAECKTCGSWISTKHIHIDYVGHADVTTRLLEADPDWGWEPQARDIDPAVLAAAVATGNPDVVRMVLEASPPKFDLDDRGGPVGLWINLTVGGVTRPGYGSVPSGQFDAVKVLIGDALRNGAMRFGVALALWAKGERADPTAENATAPGGNAVRNGSRSRESFDDASPVRPSGQQNGSPVNGTVARPPAQQRPAPTGEIDPDAQVFADEAAAALTLNTLKDIHERATKAGKIGATIASPSTGALGVLGVFVEWKRKQLATIAAALKELHQAGAAQKMPVEDLEIAVKHITGKSIDDASAADLRKAAKTLKEGAAA